MVRERLAGQTPTRRSCSMAILGPWRTRTAVRTTFSKFVALRQAIYATVTTPLLRDYRMRGLAIEVDGVGDVDTVSPVCAKRAT
jgi:hypothetical protein